MTLNTSLLLLKATLDLHMDIKTDNLIEEWAKKEFKNLDLLYELRYEFPAPLKQINNILVMEYIGDENKAAPMLKDVLL